MEYFFRFYFALRSLYHQFVVRCASLFTFGNIDIQLIVNEELTSEALL